MLRRPRGDTLEEIAGRIPRLDPRYLGEIELAVERHPMPAKGGRDLGQLRKVLCALAAVARAQRDRTAVVAQLRLAAVPRDRRDPSRNGAAGLEIGACDVLLGAPRPSFM